MAGKSLDPQVLTSIGMEAIEQILSKIPSNFRSEPAKTQELEIEEYDGQMKAVGGDRFDAPCFVSSVNYYLSKADASNHKPKGALVFYLDSENASKLLKFLEIRIPDDEDDRSMLDASGKFCGLISLAFKDRLVAAGYPELVMSEPYSNKNSIIGGVEFSTDQTKKIEFSFVYFKRKSIIVEISLADIPSKK